MEEMIGMAMRPKIKFKDFLKEYKECLTDIIPSDEPFDMIKAMGFDDQESFQEARENCSLDQMAQDEDIPVDTFQPGISEMYRQRKPELPEEALELKTLSALLECKQSSLRNPFRNSRDVYKMVQLPSDNNDNDDASTDEREKDEKCHFYNDIIVTIRVYRPTRATHIGKSLEKPVFAEEFQCLGSNFLTEFRDKISCMCNSGHFFDISDNPKIAIPLKTTDPGFFFITDTFYNDNRIPGNVDYSETIRNWAKTTDNLVDLDFKVATMETTRFIDLEVSIGFPQLYQHHGNCEHVFVFSQAEVLTPGSQLLLSHQYPRMCSFGLYNQRKCNLCCHGRCSYIVEGSDRQVQDPAYLCYKCFHSFHYIDGKKIGFFKAYCVKSEIGEVPSESTEDETTKKEDNTELSLTSENSD